VGPSVFYFFYVYLFIFIHVAETLTITNSEPTTMTYKVLKHCLWFIYVTFIKSACYKTIF